MRTTHHKAKLGIGFPSGEQKTTNPKTNRVHKWNTTNCGGTKKYYECVNACGVLELQ